MKKSRATKVIRLPDQGLNNDGEVFFPTKISNEPSIGGGGGGGGDDRGS